jgi:uncharacterized protein (DUF1684 family)
MKRLALLLLLTALPALAADYASEIKTWRVEREARLKAEGGWLSVAGLYWLKDGENRFGSAAENAIVLPASAPAAAGVFELKNGETRVRLEPGIAATLDGQPATTGVMRPDTAGTPSVLALGRLTLHVIERSGQFAIRLKDNDSARRKAFQGLVWYPVSEAYRVTAKWVAYPKSVNLPIPNVLGRVESMPSPGYAVFTLNGRELRLDPVLEGQDADELFFIFRDETAPRETYGGGRFLYSALPKDGRVVLDFNKAYSPPCAFTDYATCPLPPKQNRLPIRIEAGEKSPPGAAHPAAR